MLFSETIKALMIGCVMIANGIQQDSYTIEAYEESRGYNSIPVPDDQRDRYRVIAADGDSPALVTVKAKVYGVDKGVFTYTAQAPINAYLSAGQDDIRFVLTSIELPDGLKSFVITEGDDRRIVSAEDPRWHLRIQIVGLADGARVPKLMHSAKLFLVISGKGKEIATSIITRKRDDDGQKAAKHAGVIPIQTPDGLRSFVIEEGAENPIVSIEDRNWHLRIQGIELPDGVPVPGFIMHHGTTLFLVISNEDLRNEGGKDFATEL